MDPNIAIVMVAAINVIGLFVTASFAYMAQHQSRANAIGIQEIKTATNGLTERLVIATSDAAFAAGGNEARIAGEKKADDLAAAQETSK